METRTFKEIYDLRLLLEPYALDTAIRNMDPTKLRKIYQEFEELRKIKDVRQREMKSLEINQGVPSGDCREV